MIAMKLLKFYAIISAAIILTVFAFAIIRTFSLAIEDALPACTTEEVDFIPNEGLSDRLSEALRYKTISYAPGKYEENELKYFLTFLTKSFPLVHSSALIRRELVNGLSVLYTVKGSDPTLKPYMLAGHMDVVPVDFEKWDVAPFSGKVENGFINGRGAIDCKHIVLGVLEALEFLLKHNFRPMRSFFMAFGHDEEEGGFNGANHINQLLLSRGVNLEYLLDEGSFLMAELIPGVKVPTAMIGVSEKGSLNIRLSVESPPGHSSAPPKETAIVILAKAVSKLPGDVFPSLLGSTMDYEFFRGLAPYASLPFRFVYANFWLFRPIISWTMSRSHIMRTLMQTTTAVTMISGGMKQNVLPSNATATVNLRVHPLQTNEEAVEYVRNVIDDDRIHIQVLSSVSPHPISPYSTTEFGFNTIKDSIRQIFPDSCVLPTTLVANTDTRWYLNLTKSIYRFSPVKLKPHETSRFHGHNEKIAIDNYVQVVNFYLHLIKNSDKKELRQKHQHQDL